MYELSFVAVIVVNVVFASAKAKTIFSCLFSFIFGLYAGDSHAIVAAIPYIIKFIK